MVKYKQPAIVTARISFEISKELFDTIQQQKTEIKEKNYPFEHDWEAALKKEVAAMKKAISVQNGETPATKKKGSK